MTATTRTYTSPGGPQLKRDGWHIMDVACSRYPYVATECGECSDEVGMSWHVKELAWTPEHGVCAACERALAGEEQLAIF